tara:strand:- start:1052 stop:1621 length:570 start_codon:yes stop_codon:yes gene_type:complete
MNKLTLYLILITLVYGNIYGEIFHFKDGTVIDGKIFEAKGFEANAKGVILTIDGKVYIHHYPYKKGLSCAPPIYYPYIKDPNPYGISKCTPTRISFFNFETYSLMDVKERITRSRIPYAKKLESVRMINYVGINDKPKYMTPSREKTRRWESNVKIWSGSRIKQGMAVWGEDLIYVRPRKGIDFVNNSR